jgi:hypothetical protein
LTRDERLVEALSAGGGDRNEVLAALRALLEAERDVARLQAARCAIASAARIARASGDEELAEALFAVASSRDGEWLVTAGAAELTAEIDPARVVCRFRAEAPPLGEDVARYLSDAGPRSTGPGIEGKLRVTELARGADGVLHVELTATTWEEARGFQLALLARAETLATRRPTWRWIDAAFTGRPAVPGLAAVHAIVVTSDRKVVLLRRAPAVTYKPGHWSSTFEEQIVPGDLDGDATFARALARGLREECGLESAPRVRYLPPVLELDSLNIAFPAVVEITESAPAVASALARARNDREVDGVAFADLDAERFDVTPLHPAALIRCRALARSFARH